MRARTFWIAVMLLLLGSAPARATTVVSLSESEMTEQAEWIGVGQVASARSEWIGRRIWTVLELQVSETLKGTSAPSVTVVVPGGTDTRRGLAYIVPGVAPFIPKGARMMIFGRKTELVAGAFHPIGLVQGLFFIQVDTQGVDRAARDLSLVKVQAEGSGSGPGASERLAEMRERVQALVRRGMEQEIR
jgi:hypothetical protein